MKKWICLAVAISMMCYISACGKEEWENSNMDEIKQKETKQLYLLHIMAETDMSYTNSVLLKDSAYFPHRRRRCISGEYHGLSVVAMR